MAQEKQFVNEALKRLQIEEFLQKEFSRAGYSHSEIQRTPLSMRVTIYAHKPGLIIGRGGRNIEMISRKLSTDFGYDNPQIDVQEIRNPDTDPEIVAKQIASGIERGFNYKRIANLTVQRVMNAGAVGIAIRIGGKVGGEMSRVEKFSAGYLKFAGDPADTLVKKAYARAKVKLGLIGIQVRILPVLPAERVVMQKIEALTREELIAAPLAIEEVKEEKKVEEKKEELKVKTKEERDDQDNIAEIKMGENAPVKVEVPKEVANAEEVKEEVKVEEKKEEPVEEKKEEPVEEKKEEPVEEK
ncbi:MAG: 30S ribosomal protein S3, partial [Candidatus Aenigmarchaeota archaeon]|nr:30S ribosomal protein S3 [Candidatus Aenigmarchaeota archaeon]